MKRYLSDFIFTEGFIFNSMLECLSHNSGGLVRWNRRDTAYFLAEYFIRGGYSGKDDDRYGIAKYIHRTVDDYIIFYQFNLGSYIAHEMYKEIKERTIEVDSIHYQQRVDKSSGKVREIGITSIKQQVYDYICVNALKPMLDAKIAYYQCSSIKGRGQEHARKAIEKCIRQKHKNARYVIKADIKKCYQSISHRRLFKLLERDVKNDDVLYLVKTLVSTYSDCGVGLCIGTYLSQYLANYYLSYAYHFVTETACVLRRERRTERMKEIRPFERVVFYMDDMVFIGGNKKYMKKVFWMLIDYLHDELGLELKNDTYLVIDLFKEGAFVDVVGYRFYRDHTTIRERIFDRISDDTRKINKFRADTDVATCRSFMARNGYVKYSDSKTFKRKSKYKTAYKTAIQVIRNETKSNLHRKTA